jgi:hypothetical protein
MVERRLPRIVRAAPQFGYADFWLLHSDEAVCIQRRKMFLLRLWQLCEFFASRSRAPEFRNPVQKPLGFALIRSLL